MVGMEGIGMDMIGGVVEDSKDVEEEDRGEYCNCNLCMYISVLH